MAPNEEPGAPIASRRSITVESCGKRGREVRLLLPEEQYCALLADGHIACVPTIEMIERWNIPEGVYEVLIPRASVKAMASAADWCDKT